MLCKSFEKSIVTIISIVSGSIVLCNDVIEHDVNLKCGGFKAYKQLFDNWALQACHLACKCC